MYVVVKEVLNKQAHVEAVEINYLTFYAFNGPYTIGVPPFSFDAGAHDGDWEHFTVRYVVAQCMYQFARITSQPTLLILL